VRRILLIALVAVPLSAGGSYAGAQVDPTTTTSVVVELPPADIIPQPNSGAAPEEAGDRGGALQLALLGIIVLAVAAGVAHVVRQARRTQAEREA
jgi:uncharacterized protein HemX